MGGNADMPCCASKCNKVKKSGSSMDMGSNTPSQGMGGGNGGGQYRTKHGAPSGPNQKAVK